jgi:DNA topoisomerase-1
LRTLVSEQLADIDAREINSIPIGDGVMVRVGRYGPYVQKGEERASIPEDLPPDELTVERADDLLQAGSTDRMVGTDPATGLPVLIRAGRFGPYVQLGDTDDGAGVGVGAGAGAGAGGKPRTASLLSHHDPQKVTLDEALKLLTLPRVVGVDPSDGEEIVAQNGRYGPYLRKGKDSRSLATEAQLFDVTLEEALALFAQPKVRRGQQPTAPLRTLGDDPDSGQPIVLRDGRFGPYVTDGTTNASLRKGDTVDGLTHERAVELLADRRAAGPSARTRKARGTKKTGAANKAAAAKKTSKTSTNSKKVAQKRA